MTAVSEPTKTERLLKLAADHADDFATRAAQHDLENTFPFENIEAMKKTKYTALTLPESVGGLGANILEFGLCQERLAQGCAATALAINMHLFGLGAMAESGEMTSDPMRQAMAAGIAGAGIVIGGGFTEREIGGNWGFPTTRAEKVEGGYRITGRKSFGSLSPVMDLVGVTTTIVENGTPTLIGTFFVPRATPGVEFIENWNTMGMRATGSHDIKFENVFAGDAQLVASRPPGEFDPMGVGLFAWFSVSIASVYTGIATAARNLAVETTGNRKLAIMPKPLSHLPGVQFATAEMDVTLSAMRALTRQLAEEWMEGKHRTEAGVAEMMKAKYFATSQAINVVNHAMNIVGAWSIFRESPLERYYRDVRPGVFHPLNNDVLREAIGKAAYGIPMNEEPRWI